MDEKENDEYYSFLNEADLAEQVLTREELEEIAKSLPWYAPYLYLARFFLPPFLVLAGLFALIRFLEWLRQ